jgi:hypothetical protein
MFALFITDDVKSIPIKWDFQEFFLFLHYGLVKLRYFRKCQIYFLHPWNWFNNAYWLFLIFDFGLVSFFRSFKDGALFGLASKCNFIELLLTIESVFGKLFSWEDWREFCIRLERGFEEMRGMPETFWKENLDGFRTHQIQPKN